MPRAIVNGRIYEIIDYDPISNSYELSHSGNDRISMNGSKVETIEQDRAIAPVQDDAVSLSQYPTTPANIPPEYDPKTGTDLTPPEGSPLPSALSDDPNTIPTQPKKGKTEK